jgi:hypothetical protein
VIRCTLLTFLFIDAVIPESTDAKFKINNNEANESLKKVYAVVKNNRGAIGCFITRRTAVNAENLLSCKEGGSKTQNQFFSFSILRGCKRPSEKSVVISSCRSMAPIF